MRETTDHKPGIAPVITTAKREGTEPKKQNLGQLSAAWPFMISLCDVEYTILLYYLQLLVIAP
jgi:hypothetical protein